MKSINTTLNNVAIDVSWFQRQNTAELHLAARACEPKRFDRELEEVFAAMALFFEQEGIPFTTAVFLRLFVSDFMNQEDSLGAFAQNGMNKFSRAACSVVEQPPLTGNKVLVWLYAIVDHGAKGLSVDRSEGQIVVKREGMAHIWSTGMRAKEPGWDSHAQTSAVFAQLERRLRDLNCTVQDNCVRTWLFVKDIDFNYPGVVRSRRDLFETLGMTKDTHYIASTGIEGRHADPGTSVLMDAYAIAGLAGNQVRYLQALQHLNPTHEYGVTFERGTSVDFGDRRHIYISGTASINNRGEIVHKNNVRRQMERVIENIAALLADAGATLADIAHMIVYLRDLSDAPDVERYFAEHFRETPKAVVLAPVCRPGWLVEIECIAVMAIDRTDVCRF